MAKKESIEINELVHRAGSGRYGLDKSIDINAPKSKSQVKRIKAMKETSINDYDRDDGYNQGD